MWIFILISSYFLFMDINSIFTAYSMNLVSSKDCYDMLQVHCYLLRKALIPVLFLGTGKEYIAMLVISTYKDIINFICLDLAL